MLQLLVAVAVFALAVTLAVQAVGALRVKTGEQLITGGLNTTFAPLLETL